MKKMLFVVLFVLATGGCRGLNRLIDGPEPDVVSNPDVISSNPPLTEAPDFGIQPPAGFTKIVFYGRIVSPYQVKIEPSSGSILVVAVKDVGQWFKLQDSYSGAYWYEDLGNGIIQYKGPYLSNKDYCIYQYIPN